MINKPLLFTAKERAMSSLSSIFKVQVMLHKEDGLGIRHDAANIFRWDPMSADPENIAARKAAGAACTTIYYSSGQSCSAFKVLETSEEVSQKIEEAEDRVIERMKKHRLAIM
tara:strand:- start:335 stop:673 length:339 start_codon:yes stop_codon:yes gene_type:complete